MRNATVVVSDSSPDIPETVIVAVLPNTALLSAAIVSVVDDPACTDGGWNVSVTWAGAPLALKLIVSPSPLKSCVEIVTKPLCPGATSTYGGSSCNENVLV